MIPFPNKKYNIIYADPPWSYSDSGCAGAAAAQYSTMKIDELMKQMGILKTVGRRKATRSDATEAVWARVHTAAADQTAAAPADNPATGPEQMTLLGPGA